MQETAAATLRTKLTMFTTISLVRVLISLVESEPNEEEEEKME